MSRRERFERSAAEVAVNVVLGLGRGIRYGVDDHNNYFQEAREHLGSGTNEDKPSSLVVVANIGDWIETRVIADVVARRLTTLDRVSTITSVEFLDSKRNRLTSALIKRASEAKGFRVFPVIPPNEMDYYRNREHADAISGKTPRRFTAEAMIEAIEVLKRPGEVLIISPEQIDEEGTNPANRVRQLARAYEGLDTILRHSRKTTLILPVALIRPTERKFVPPYSKITVIPGPIFSHETIEQEYEIRQELAGGKSGISMNDLIMMRLAQLHPPRNQGYYRPLIAHA